MEVDLPSVKIKENKSAKPWFMKEKVCDAVECVNCGRWRCDFTPAKPSHTNMNKFHPAIETLMYTCGDSVLSEGHPAVTVFVIRH